MTGPIQQDPVAAAIWRWRENPARPVGDTPAKRALKALVQCAIMLAVAAWLAFRVHQPIPAGVLTALAVLIFICAVAFPRVFQAFERMVGRIAHGVGTAMTWLLLTPFFYLVFVPGRVFLALRGKDPLSLKFPTDKPTYWVPWKPPPTKEHYKKQYR